MCLNLVVWLVVSLRCGEKSERFRIGADPAEFYIVAWRGKVGRSERPTEIGETRDDVRVTCRGREACGSGSCGMWECDAFHANAKRLSHTLVMGHRHQPRFQLPDSECDMLDTIMLHSSIFAVIGLLFPALDSCILL